MHFLQLKLLIFINTSLKFVPKVRINNIPILVQIIAWRRPGDKPLSGPAMVSLLTHICVTRPQWINNGNSTTVMKALAIIRLNWAKWTHLRWLKQYRKYFWKDVCVTDTTGSFQVPKITKNIWKAFICQCLGFSVKFINSVTKMHFWWQLSVKMGNPRSRR